MTKPFLYIFILAKEDIILIIEMLIISVSTVILILILRALKHSSKDCEFNLEINIKDFKFSFKTKERNTPIK